MFPVHWAAMSFFSSYGPVGEITDAEGRAVLGSGAGAAAVESLERLGDALFVPGAFVAAGALIAPKFHLGTAIVLSVLLVGFYSWVFAQAAASLAIHIADGPVRQMILVVLWLVSIGSALWYARDLDKGA
jgi:hypothetical protein